MFVLRLFPTIISGFTKRFGYFLGLSRADCGSGVLLKRFDSKKFAIFLVATFAKAKLMAVRSIALFLKVLSIFFKGTSSKAVYLFGF